VTDGLLLGDNLAWLRDAEAVPDGSVHLVYMDPPFASGKDYGLLPGDGTRASGAASRLFTDSWRWDDAAAASLDDLRGTGERRALDVIDCLVRVYGQGPLSAYAAMMAPRLAALRRVLAPSASLYLHCDPTASFALRLLLDAVFGPGCLRREIVWRGGWISGFKSRQRNWARNHDVILYATTGPDPVFHRQRQPHPPGYARRGAGGPATDGVSLDDVWTDIFSPWIQSFSREKTGFATQKPLALLKRIVAASSDPGQQVLDPFCGSGTTLLAARALGRHAVGMDREPLALAVTRSRLLASEGLPPPAPGHWAVAMPPPATWESRAVTAWACLALGALPVAPRHAGPLRRGELRDPVGRPLAGLCCLTDLVATPDAASVAAAVAEAGHPDGLSCLAVVRDAGAPHPPGRGVELGHRGPGGARLTLLETADVAAIAAGDAPPPWRSAVQARLNV
jgi:DNA modification methylase